MNPVVKLRSLELDRMIHNIHFWIILAVIAVLTLIYYAWNDWFPWFWQVFFFEYRNDMLGSLFLIPFVYASLIFWWRGSVIIWLLSAVVTLPRLMYYSPDLESFIRNVALPFVPLAVVIIITLELKWREKQRETLAEGERERQAYMSQILKAQEDERRRISQELHDGTMQELLVIANRAHSLVSGEDSSTAIESRRHAEWIRDAILRASEDIRRLSLDLRPSILDNVGLVPALRWLVDRLNQEGGINAKVMIHGVERKLRPETEVTIFRIVQEALNNIRRHSKATEAMVKLEFAPKSLEIAIQDNGKGFFLNETIEKLAAQDKFGLIGMHQRAKVLNSALDIYSQLGKGTLVSIKMVD